MIEKIATTSATQRLLDDLDGDEETSLEAMRKLRKSEGICVPKLLLEKYRRSKQWHIRQRCLDNCLNYARDFPAAIELGLEALTDRSKKVRHMACMLLAFSLNRDVLPSLNAVLEEEVDDSIRADIKAAIDCIESQNHHYFFDRDHLGFYKYVINFRHPKYG